MSRIMRKQFASVVFVAVLHSTPSMALKWTAYGAISSGADMPQDIPVLHQERAYTSAIWYTP